MTVFSRNGAYYLSTNIFKFICNSYHVYYKHCFQRFPMKEVEERQRNKSKLVNSIRCADLVSQRLEI